MKLHIAFAALVMCACKSPAPVAVKASAPLSTLPLRLVDHAADARVEGDLGAAYSALTYALVSPSPLAPELASPRALQVTFAEPSLDRLLPKGSSDVRGTAKRAPAIDLTWNRNNGIYDAREALFLPASVRYLFELPAGPPAVLRAELGIPPGGTATDVAVGLDGKELDRLKASTRGAWHPVEVAIPARDRSVTLSLAANGPPGAVAFLGVPIVSVPAPTQRTNVIFVLVDTLRADALPAMPRLRALAATGARFDTAITAATWTRPSLIAAFGGDLATRLGHSAEDMIPSERERHRFRSVRPLLLPRRLGEAGYLTRAIGNNFFLLGFPRIGLDLGIDAVTDVRHPVLDTPAITAEAIRFLQAPHDRPFFLYLHYDAPHWPYLPPPAFRAAARGLTLSGLDAKRDDDIGAYLGEAAYADHAIGQLTDALRASGLADKTIIVVVGDHGEIFDPAHAHTVDALALPTLHHHGWSAYDEIDHVPLVIAWPGHIAPRTIATQTSLIDLAPTLIDLLGLPASTTHGVSLAQLLLDGKKAWPTDVRPAFIEGQNVRAVRDGAWLYLKRTDGHLHAGKLHRDVPEELYELASDPLQHHDRVADPSAPLAHMRALFASLAPSLPAFSEPVLHLAVAPAATSHAVRGEVRCGSCKIELRKIDGGHASVTKNGVALDLREGAHVEMITDPADAALEIALTRDGVPIDASHLLLGPLGLPLLGPQATTPVAIPTAKMTWLDAARAPYLSDTADVLLWRDPSTSGGANQRTAAADSEVATMMQRWGYAQPAHAP